MHQSSKNRTLNLPLNLVNAIFTAIFNEVSTMQKSINKQLGFGPSIDELVKKDHPYRKVSEMVDFEGLTRMLRIKISRYGRPGYNMTSSFKALILQWMEDLSDRELERFLQENNAAKLFCGYQLMEQTPDHTHFTRTRERIGTSDLVKLFNKFGAKLKEKNITSEVFTFVDASHLISKSALWEERDKAIAAGQEKLNNLNVREHAKDKDADYGCKGTDKYWYGYKRHVAVDAKSGMITKVAATKASLTDAKGLKHVCPRSGMVMADKGYCSKDAQSIIKARGCHSGAILKNNMKGKNKDKDKFISRLRMPFENVFSKMDKRVRYRGLKKVQFQVTMQAMAFNLKRLVVIGSAPPLKFV
jgi:IS5 family transposase